MKKIMTLLGAGLLVISSCSKSNSPSTNARVLFANSCIGAASESLTVNGASLSNAGVPYLGNY